MARIKRGLLSTTENSGSRHSGGPALVPNRSASFTPRIPARPIDCIWPHRPASPSRLIAPSRFFVEPPTMLCGASLVVDLLNRGQLVSPTSRMVLQIAEYRTMRTSDILAGVRGHHATSEHSSSLRALLRTKHAGPQDARPHSVTRRIFSSSLSAGLGPFRVSLGASQRRCRW